MGHRPFPKNQRWIADAVLRTFKDTKIVNVMVLAKTQSGKTGSMCATIKKFFKSESMRVPKDHIFVITGLSSCEWKDQTMARIPECLKENIFHRNDLSKTFVEKIKGRRNVLVIMDEVQVASKQKQTVAKVFRDAGMTDRAALYANDVKILEFTATPNGTLYDLMEWGEASCKIVAEAGAGYTSSFKLYETNKLRQYKPLCSENREDALQNVREIEVDVASFAHPMYHIIRSPRWINDRDLQEETMQNFRSVFPVDHNQFLRYDQENEIDINDLLKMPPRQHTFIFIKEMLRCAKTLDKRHIGVMYERFNTAADDSSVIQGLVGRLTGYDYNGVSVCYTNVESVLKYERLWVSGFEDKSVEWRSSTTRFDLANGITSRRTFNGLDTSDAESDDSAAAAYRMYAVEDVARRVCRQLYGKNFKMKCKDEKGFNMSSPGGGKARILSVDEAIKAVPKCLLKNTKHLCIPCYTDPEDLASIRFVIVVHSNVAAAQLADIDQQIPSLV